MVIIFRFHRNSEPECDKIYKYILLVKKESSMGHGQGKSTSRRQAWELQTTIPAVHNSIGQYYLDHFPYIRPNKVLFADRKLSGV